MIHLEDHGGGGFVFSVFGEVSLPAGVLKAVGLDPIAGRFNE